MRRSLAAAALALAGCGGDGAEVLDAPRAAAGEPRVIVAVIDSAFNPYHEFYYAGSSIYRNSAPSSVTPAVLAELGVPPENVIELTRTGRLDRDKNADAAKWAKVRRGKPYWFKGTNLVGVAFSGAPMLVPNAAKNPHGVGVTASVLTANPDAVVVFTETWDNYANDEAAQYAFTHPAIDIVNSSYGWCVPVVCTFGFPSLSSVAHSYDGVVKMGKLHLQSSGNEPGVTPVHGGQGQWWEIGIGGIEEHSSNGQTALARQLPDFVGDYSQDLPYCQDCERGTSSIGGTSFSSPSAAGVVSRVLLEARRALGHKGGIRIKPDGTTVMAEGNGRGISNWQLRRALEEGAFADYGVQDYDPVAGAGDLVGLPINDAAPVAQVGWGHLTEDPEKRVVAETLAHLGFGTPTRSKGPDFCEFQAALMRFRQTYWSTGDAAEPLPDPNPYIFCDTALP